MGRPFSSWILLTMVAAVVVDCWQQNNQQPKRDTGAAVRSIADALQNRNVLLDIGASYAFGKILLGQSTAASAVSDVAPSMLGQRGSSMDSQAYQPGVKLKDVYYPSWWAFAVKLAVQRWYLSHQHTVIYRDNLYVACMRFVSLISCHKPHIYDCHDS